MSDIVPTVLELLGVEAPTVHRGVPQLPIHGVSMAYTFDDAEGPTRKRTQYYEMLGDRALWHDGWKAVARHSAGSDFEADRWELYHLGEDYAEAHDLAAEDPGKLREMIERWWTDAGRFDALPLDDRGGGARTRWGGWTMPRTAFTYYPDMARVERWVTPNVADRSYTVSADVEIPHAGAEGVLVAAGGRFGGWVLFVADGRLVHEYNFGEERYVLTSERPVRPGRHTLGFAFAKTGELRGDGTLTIDGDIVATGELPRTWPINPAQAALHCGRDGGSPVSEAYQSPFAFTGRLHRVVVELAADQQHDWEAERRAALAED